MIDHLIESHIRPLIDVSTMQWRAHMPPGCESLGSDLHRNKSTDRLMRSKSYTTKFTTSRCNMFLLSYLRLPWCMMVGEGQRDRTVRGQEVGRMCLSGMRYEEATSLASGRLLLGLVRGNRVGWMVDIVTEYCTYLVLDLSSWFGWARMEMT